MANIFQACLLRFPLVSKTHYFEKMLEKSPSFNGRFGFVQ
jgi:hypothetical protein